MKNGFECVLEKTICGKKVFVFKIDEHFEIFESGMFYASVDSMKEVHEELEFFEMAEEFIEQREKELKKGKRKK